MSQGSEKRAGTTDIRIGIGSALVIALTVLATYTAGFGLLHNDISSLREETMSQFESVRDDMRGDHAAMRGDILELQVGVGRLEVRMDYLEQGLGNVDQRLGDVEQRLGNVEQRLGRVEGVLGVQLPGDSAIIP